MKFFRVLIAALLCSALGCADDEEAATLPCNVGSRACQKAVFKATVAARGQTGAVMPPVRVITRKQLAEELRREVSGSANERDRAQALEDRQSQQAMALLRLLPEPREQSSDDAYVEQAVDGIAAYYSSFSKDITVIDDQAEDVDNGTFTLSHEFVHALQDQREDLNAWRRPLIKSSDNSVASKCLTEGEAVWLSYVTYYGATQQLEPEWIDTERLFSSMLGGFLTDIGDTSAPFISALETLPYPMGGARVSDIYLGEGPAAVSGLYARPLLSLREWAEGDVASALPEELDCELPPAPEGFSEVLSDKLGFAGLLAFHTGLGWDGATSYEAALPWRADRIVGYASSDDPEAVVVAWRLRLENAAAADQLGQLARDAQLDALPLGNELLITASTRPELTRAWAPHDSCVASDKSRSSTTIRRRLTVAERLGIER